MAADFCSNASDGSEPNDELVWRDLLLWLLPYVKAWVYGTHVDIWYGQQCEIAEEIVQEALTRAFECVKRARQNEGPPVIHLRALCRTIAQHLLLDRIRKERHLVRPAFNDDLTEMRLVRYVPDAAEIALDHLSDEETIINAVEIIVNLPDKRKAALLMELANATDFAAPPSLLEQALAEEYIQLGDYVRPRSDDQAERSRHAALLWHARKQLRDNL